MVATIAMIDFFTSNNHNSGDLRDSWMDVIGYEWESCIYCYQ